MTAKISILICAHNEEKYIRTSLDSVLKESDLDIEIVVVDDRSTDTTPDILKAYSLKYPILKIITRVDDKCLENVNKGLYYMQDHGCGGQTDALNLGLLHCTGDYIARLDADDVNLPKRLKTQLAFMEKNFDVSFLACSAIRIDGDGREFGRYHSKPMKHETILENIEIFKAYAPHSSWFVRASVYHELGGYHREGFRAEDLDFMLRASELKEFKFAFLEQPLIYLRMQDGRLSTCISTRPVEHAIEAVVRHMLRLDGEVISEKTQKDIRKIISERAQDESLVNSIIAYRSLVNAYTAIKQRNLKDFFYSIYMIIKSRPKMLFKHNELSEKKLEYARDTYQYIRKESGVSNVVF